MSKFGFSITNNSPHASNTMADVLEQIAHALRQGAETRGGLMSDHPWHIGGNLEVLRPLPGAKLYVAPAPQATPDVRADVRAEPAAWLYEVRFDGTHGHAATDWKTYCVYNNQAQAEAHLRLMGTGLVGRAVPLYRAPIDLPPEQPMPDAQDFETGEDFVGAMGYYGGWNACLRLVRAASAKTTVAGKKLGQPEYEQTRERVARALCGYAIGGHDPDAVDNCWRTWRPQADLALEAAGIKP